MEFNFKKIILLLLTSLLLSCNNNDDDIDPKNTADLSIAVAASTNNPIANTNLTFTLIAANKGPLDATEVGVSNVILSGYTFISAEPSSGTYDEETGIWEIGELTNGASAMLIINVKVNETGEYQNKASITGEQPDIVMSNNDLTSLITLKPLTDDLLYTFTLSDGPNPETTITGLSQLWKDLPMDSKYDLTIPASINGHPVTKIGDEAFQLQNQIRSVTISDGVSIIGDFSFAYCYSLTTVTIPASVTAIDEGAFYQCEKLNAITIPNSDATIASKAFEQCSGLTSVVLPAHLAVIESNVFSGCGSLEEITLPDSVESIRDGAFMYCLRLKNITLPDNLTDLGHHVFIDCLALTHFKVNTNSYFSVIDGVLYDKEVSALLYFPNGKSGTLSIPENVIRIGSSACANSKNLTEVFIPNTVTLIESNAFADCTSLTTVTIPASVQNIQFFAFSNNTALTSVIMNPVVPPATYKPFHNCKNLNSIQVVSSSLETYKTGVEWSQYKDILVAQ